MKQTCAHNKAKGLCLGLGFGFGYFINELYNLKEKKIFLIFEYGFEYKFKKIEKNQN